MLAIFFPHMYEDIEYLLAPEDLVKQTGADGQSPAVPDDARRRLSKRAIQVNAVAGPSRAC